MFKTKRKSLSSKGTVMTLSMEAQANLALSGKSIMHVNPMVKGKTLEVELPPGEPTLSRLSTVANVAATIVAQHTAMIYFVCFYAFHVAGVTMHTSCTRRGGIFTSWIMSYVFAGFVISFGAVICVLRLPGLRFAGSRAACMYFFIIITSFMHFFQWDLNTIVPLDSKCLDLETKVSLPMGKCTHMSVRQSGGFISDNVPTFWQETCRLEQLDHVFISTAIQRKYGLTLDNLETEYRSTFPLAKLDYRLQSLLEGMNGEPSIMDKVLCAFMLMPCSQECVPIPPCPIALYNITEKDPRLRFILENDCARIQSSLPVGFIGFAGLEKAFVDFLTGELFFEMCGTN